MDDEQFFFVQTRDHIKHEDNLINNRMTWLVALQSFLFGAYGFSLSAGATVITGIGIAQDKLVETLATIDRAREGFALMGILSSCIVLVGLAAAARAMQVFVRKWNEHSDSSSRDFPTIIGNLDITRRRFAGIFFGLCPPIGLPLSCIGVWSYLEGGRLRVFVLSILLATLLLVFLMFYWGYLVGRRQKT